MSRCHAVCVTYRRPDALIATLAAIAEQRQQIASITIVDNDPEAGAAHVMFPREETLTKVIQTGRNLGPAGGFHVGVVDVLQRADDDDWLFFVDDDDPPVDGDVLSDGWATAMLATAAGLRVGAVGPVGARLGNDGRLQRVRDDERGLVQVHYIGSGNYPLYSVKALRTLKSDVSSFFFGFEDLAIGLELISMGYVLVVDGEKLHQRRARRGVLGATAREALQGNEPPAWRRYYSARNLTSIVAQYRGQGAAVLCGITEIAAGVRAGIVTRDRERFAASLSGVMDAARSRSGIRYLPQVPLRVGEP